MKIQSDYKVRPRTELEIKALANQCRQRGGIDRMISFNIVSFLRNNFQSKTGNDKLHFAVVPENHPLDLPYIKFDPLTLFVSRRILRQAELGHSFPRFQLAHEAGHIVMHNNHAKAFSNDKSSQIRYAEEIYSAEWQANTFAKYFLLPDWVMYSARTAEKIIAEAQVPTPLYDERTEDIIALNEARATKVGFDPQAQFELKL